MSYLQLAYVVLALAAVVLVVTAVLRRPSRRWWLTTGLTAVALLVLTAVFDSLMIAVDLYRYEEEALAGVHLGNVPIEDFAWPLVAAMVVPSLMLLLSGQKVSAKEEEQ